MLSYSGPILQVPTVFFFFSSRRRHTRWTGDWSSDVCSSDLLHRVRRAWREESHSQQSAYNREDTEGHDVGAAERYRLARAARNESAKLLRQATLRENASCAAAPEK